MYIRALALEKNDALIFKELGDVFLEIGDSSFTIQLYQKANSLRYDAKLNNQIKELIYL